MVLFTLPFLCLWSLVVLIEQRRSGVAWRHGAVVATVATGVLTTIFIEGLSLAGILGPLSLLACWVIACAGAVMFLVKTGGLTGLKKNPLQGFEEYPGGSLIGASGVILFLVGITAVVAPPMTSDAMVYHMTKVFFWQQNGSVSLFPTANFQQLLAPGAEYQILQWSLFLGSDVFSNIPQWTGMALSAICASLICQELRGGKMAQVITALFVLTIPEGILQASGAKNDYVMTGWILSAAYWTLRFRRQPESLVALLGGASIGLAVLTKGTAYPFLPALGLAMAWVGAGAVKGGMAKPQQILRHGLLLAAVAVALNAPQMARNYTVFGNLWGRSELEAGSPCQLTNRRISAGVVWSNAIRNVALHTGTAFPSWNVAILKNAKSLIEMAGENVNDPATTWCGTSFDLPPARRHEILAGNTFHLLSLVVLLPIAFLVPSVRRRFPQGLAYAGLVILSLVVFCGLLQWQPWHTRFHVTYFAAFAPFVGLILAEAIPSGAMVVATSFWVIYAGPYVLLNESRPLLGTDSILGRERAYMIFNDRAYHTFPFRKAVEVIVQKNCSRIGLSNIVDGYDYPMMTTLRQANPNVLIKYMKPMAETIRFESEGMKWQPCAVICIGCGGKPDTWAAYQKDWPETASFDHVVVFTKPGGESPAATPATGPAPASAPPAPAPVSGCTFQFGDGWYPEERTSAGYLLWMNGTAKMNFVAPTDGQYVLSGQLMSVVRPNDIRLALDGKQLQRFKVSTPEGEKLNLTIPVTKGAHTLEWTSTATPFAPPNDVRRLAGGLLNASISTDGKPCSR